MCKILVTLSVHEIGLEMLSKEKDFEINYAPDLPLAEIFKIIAPFTCIRTRSETAMSKELIN
jgi:D-3-phosphoglycerate dehydrogenase